MNGTCLYTYISNIFDPLKSSATIHFNNKIFMRNIL